jgi:hypothetical protein
MTAQTAIDWAHAAETAAGVRTPEQALAHTMAFMAERVTATTGLDLMTTAPTLDGLSVNGLYDRKDSLRRLIDVVTAEMHDADEALCLRQRDETWATWHRLSARALRTGDEKDKQRADTAWADAMAEGHLKRGTKPEPGSRWEAEVNAAMERMAP